MSGFAARRFLQLAIALVASGCAEDLPTPRQPYFGTSPTLAQPATHFYGNDVMYSSQPADNEVVVYKRKKTSYTLTPYETLTSGFSSPDGHGDDSPTAAGTSPTPGTQTSSSIARRVTGRKAPRRRFAMTERCPSTSTSLPSGRLVAVSNGSTTASGAGSV